MGFKNASAKLKLLSKWGQQCYLCKKDFPIKELTINHLIPRSQGGSNNLSNLRLACSKCNNEKGG